MSNAVVKSAIIRFSWLGMSVTSRMLCDSANELKVYTCWALYALVGSARAGRIELIITVKMSYATC